MTVPSARLGAVLGIRPREAGLAAATACVAVVGVVSEVVEAPRAMPPVAGGVVLAVAAAALLLLRGRPVVTTVGVLALCLLYHLMGYPGLAPAVALFGALYALAAEGRGVRSLLTAAAAILAVSAIPLLPPSPVALGWSVVGPGIAFVAVAALGEAARARRLTTEERLLAVRRAAELDARRRLMEERVDLAREVHDVLAHTVTVIAVQAAAADEALDDRPADAHTALRAVRAAAREALVELRGTVTLLRGGVEPAVEGPGVGQLAQLCENARSAGLAVGLTVVGERALPGVVERAVYRIVQEALTNTVRHAGAGAVAVLVELGGTAVRVEVTDDGAGSPSEVEGHGLRGMRERALALGGSFAAGPRAGRGFQVTATLPVGAAL